MLVENKSHRTSVYNRTFTSVPDSNSFFYQSGRRRAYAQRLYFEYLYTQKVNGTTYFYTLTYNDKSIPHYFKDRPCFSYADIRLVTNGALSKELERKYGSRLRYFVACETGEGKGSRGAGKNPHYHCIFFVQPLHDKDGQPIKDGYVPIKPLDFRRIIRRVWQGTENDYVNFNEAKFGICKEGDNCGLVINVAPFKYCAKYVLKENNELKLEYDIEEFWRTKCKIEGISLRVLWYYYLYNKELLDGEQCHELFYQLGLDKYNKWRKMTIDSDKSYIRFIKRYSDNPYKIEIATNVNNFYTDKYLTIFPKFKVKEYRNLYSGKVRCSKGLGEYGLNYIHNKEFNPVFNIPTPSGFDCQLISQYYYRKLYYDKIRCDVSGNVLYRLNTLGKTLKIKSLSNTIDKHTIAIKEAISVVTNNHFVEFHDLQNDILFKSILKTSDLDTLLYRYSVYKVVYEFRSYSSTDFVAISPDFDFDSIEADYRRFLDNDSYFFDYSYDTVHRKLWISSDMIGFQNHPNFNKYMLVFNKLDNVLDSARDFRSINAKAIFKANSELSAKLKASRNS